MKYIYKHILTLSFILLASLTSLACDQPGMTLVNTVDNGNGTFTYTLNICVTGGSSNFGSSTGFTLTPSGGTYTSITATTTSWSSTYQYCPGGCSGAGANYGCSVPLVTGGGTASNNLPMGGATSVTYTGSSSEGQWLGPGGLYGGCANNPTSLCQNITITTSGYPSTITLTVNEGTDNCTKIVDIPAPPVVINGCTGTFTDPGGSGGNYANNTNQVWTYCSDNGQPITISFSSFALEGGGGCPYDYLQIYDGNSTGATQIGGRYCGTNSPGTITSSGTCLTFHFISDASATAAGWVASISCACTAPSPPTAVNGQRCGTGTVPLSVTGCSGTVNWYTALTGGTSIASGSSYTTPSISATTTYYASCTVSGCESTRTAVTATINPIPNPPTAVNGQRCGTGTVPLSVTGCSGTVNWFTALTGGTSIASGSSYTTPSISATTTYYASCTVNGCQSTRTAVTATVNPIPSPPTAVNGQRCGTGTVPLSVTGCSGTVNWFTASTGGTSIASGSSYTTPSISATTTYYASCTVNGCESTRTPVTATINPIPVVNAVTSQTVCAGQSFTAVTFTGTTGSTYSWTNKIPLLV
jgi:invasion protein IalB